MHTCQSITPALPQFVSIGQSGPCDAPSDSSDAASYSHREDRSTVRIHQLSSHFIARENRLSTEEQEQISRLLAEKAFLFKHGDDLEAMGLEGTTYDVSLRPDPKGMSEEWRAWKDAVLLHTYAIYKTLSCNEAVFQSHWHPNMYGEQITHVSVIMIGKTSKGPKVVVSHHESIPVPAKVSYDDGRMPRSLGLRLDDYDTRQPYEKLTGKRMDLKDLPVVRSIRFGGFPNVNFSIARDFTHALDYHQRCLEMSRQYETELLYAPFSSREKKIPKHFYPAPDEAEIPPEKKQINTCYSAAIDLAIAAKVDGYAILERADLPQQGRQMRIAGLLANAADMRDAPPGIATFLAYGTQAGVNPVPDVNERQADFAIQGTFLKKQRQNGVSLAEYRKAIVFLKMLPDWLAPHSKSAL